MSALSLAAALQGAPQNATLAGTIQGEMQKAMPGALVTLRNASGSVYAETHSDAAGHYKFSALAPGSYILSAEGDRLTSSRRPVSLKAGETQTVDLELSPQPPGKTAQYFDEPTFTVAGVSESSGAGVHGSNATSRNADKLAQDTASLSQQLPPSSETPSQKPDSLSDPTQLRKLIAQNDQAQLHNELGHLEEHAGQPLEALKEFQRAAEMDPSESNFFDWGTELLVHRAAEPAAEVFSKGSRLHPESVRMFTGLAVAEYARGNFGAAIDRLCQASDINPSDRLPYIFLGTMQNAEIKRSAKALESLARFHELYPKDPLANLYYAIALWNQPGAAADNTTVMRVEQLTKAAIASDPRSAPAYLQLGIVQVSQNHFAEAASTLEKATALDPTLEEAHYRLAQVYRRLGNEAKAKTEFATYQTLSRTAEEDAQRQRKTVQQFVYELGTPTKEPSHSQ